MTKKVSCIALLISIIFAMIDWPLWVPQTHARAQSGAAPLPLTCVVTPIPAACAYGYVFYDGAPVTGANVIIDSPYGSLNTSTATGSMSSASYYQVNLTGAPLLVAVGDMITITATYNGETAQAVYTVAEDGQQVDIVIVRAFDDWWDPAYAYRRSLPITTGSTLAAGTMIKVDGLDLEPLVSQGKMRADHNDLRIVRRISAHNWQEVARVYFTGWDVEFQLATTLNTGIDTSYYIYYGNPTAGSPLTFSSPQGWLVDMYHDKWWSEYAGTWNFNQAMDFNNICDPPVDHDGRIGSSFDESDKYRGRLFIPYTGVWTFRVYTNDGYGVYIDGAQIGRFDGYDTNKWYTVGTMNLKAGWHRMELLDMWVNCGAWKFAMEGPSFPNQIVPANYFQPVWDGIITGITPSNEDHRTFTAPPIVTFSFMSPNSVVKQNENLTLKAWATDNDEQGAGTTQYVWRSDIGGFLGTTAFLSVPASSLTTGTHVIFVKAKDNEGVWSEEISRTIVVEQGATLTSSPTPTLTSPEKPTSTSTGTATPTPTPTITATPPNAVVKKKWTMLLYLAGDTGRIDGGAVFGELKKAVRRLESNPNPDVNVVALLDGPDDLDSFRVTFTPQANYTPLGEMPMDDPLTLVNFVKQAKQDFPAEHYYLVIADHANGVQGIAWDTTTAPNKTALLTPAKLEQALQQISSDGADPIDIVHFDGCSFGLLENVATMHNYVRYLVMSQNIGWSVFGYDQYRAALTTTTSPGAFAQTVAQLYGQVVGARQLPYTISAMDLGQLDAAMTALNGLADTLSTYVGNDATRRATITAVRSQSQKFDATRPLLQITNDDWYVDLVDFANKLQSQVADPQLSAAAGDLVTKLKSGPTPLVVYESHLTASIEQGSTDNCSGGNTWNLDNANGVSIYFPPRGGGSEFTRYTSGDTFTYFNNQSHWDEFLQGGVPPLAPGDPAPDDVPIPLAPCSVTEQTSTTQYPIYLPFIRR